MTEETHAFGSTESYSSVTRDGCLMYCKALGGKCAGVDYIRETSTCWIHSKKENLQDTEADYGTNVYAKSGDNCGRS